MTLRDLARKDVIRLSNGENLGRDDDLVIPWQSIKTIGTDAVMVEPDPDADLHRHR